MILKTVQIYLNLILLNISSTLKEKFKFYVEKNIICNSMHACYGKKKLTVSILNPIVTVNSEKKL